MLHPLLQRQLKRSGVDPELYAEGSGLSDCLERVSRSYAEADQDRYTLERSLAISISASMLSKESFLNPAESALASARQRAAQEFSALS